MTINLVSLREKPDILERGISYIQSRWPNVYPKMYSDCLRNAVKSSSALPQWYFLTDKEKIMGCAGLIPNDFISRMDLYPWFCTLYIDPEYRGNFYTKILVEKAKKDCLNFGFSNLYLCTPLVGFYEKIGFKFLAEAYHPWDEVTSIYTIKCQD